MRRRGGQPRDDWPQRKTSAADRTDRLRNGIGSKPASADQPLPETLVRPGSPDAVLPMYLSTSRRPPAGYGSCEGPSFGRGARGARDLLSRHEYVASRRYAPRTTATVPVHFAACPRACWPRGERARGARRPDQSWRDGASEPCDVVGLGAKSSGLTGRSSFLGGVF